MNISVTGITEISVTSIVSAWVSNLVMNDFDMCTHALLRSKFLTTSSRALEPCRSMFHLDVYSILIAEHIFYHNHRVGKSADFGILMSLFMDL